MAERKLRAVEPGEVFRPLSILEAAEAGNRLEELRSMRRRIARALDDVNTPARDLAALSRRQIEIGREVEALELRVREDAERGEVVSDEPFDAAAV